MNRSLRLLASCGALIMLTGCAAEVGTLNTTSPAPATPSATAEPTITDSFAPTESAAPTASATATETAADADEVLYGSIDLADVRWTVTCSSMETAPSVVGTGYDADGHELVATVTGKTDGTLVHINVGAVDLNSQQPSLSVLPLAKQGEGTFVYADGVVTSAGVGVVATKGGGQERAPYQIRLRCDRT